MAIDELETAVRVYRLLEERGSNGRSVYGVLPDDLYGECKAALGESSLLLEVDDENRKVEFSLPMSNASVFAFDLAELLRAPSRMLRCPEKFYLADIDYFFVGVDSSTPEIVKAYIDVSMFASALNRLADYSLPLIPRAIFLQGEKLELSLSYDVSNISKLDALGDFLRNFVEADIHQEQKAIIIKGVLLEMQKTNKIDRLTISCLAKRFSEFTQRVNSNYQLFVSEFSFDKIKEQVEKERLEFTLKLNKVFSEMQNQLLAIPIALVLAGGQMRESDGFSYVNLSIWWGLLTFGMFMSLLIRNQSSTLQAIKLEIDAQWESMRAKHYSVASRLDEHYYHLGYRRKMQRYFLSIVSFLVSISVAVSTFLLLRNSGMIERLQDPMILFLMFVGGGVYTVLGIAWANRFWCLRQA
ncbi:hypothetical protein [Teredinibacter turnerae]|uniref:hypothetical protein n=1 Tax=Teredinibacter turnerae TaxID=2426 RepID=UPI00037CD97B|nr:hypothetical protein [Teredinibacter turnerae]